MAEEHDDFGSISRRRMLAGSAGLVLAKALSAGPALARPGASPEAPGPAPQRSPEAELWSRFCRALEPLARHVDEAPTDDPLSKLEGIRALSRITSLGLERFLERGDPRHPSFFDVQTPIRKYLGDNPDQTYRAAEIEGGGRYRIRGTTAGSAGVEIGVYAGTFQSGGKDPSGGRRLVAHLDERTLSTEPDGRFEVSLAPDAEGTGNALRLEPGANNLLIRTYFWDRGLRLAHPRPSIERLDVEGPPPPLTAEHLARGLLATAAYVDGSLAFWNGFQAMRTAPNEIVPMADDGTVQTPDRVRYYSGIIVLEPEQAFEIVFRPEDEPNYWSWVLTNAFGETPDWRARSVVLNNREVERESDGRVRITIGHERPGRGNFLDMCGHRELYLSLRWRGESPLPALETRVLGRSSSARSARSARALS